MSSIDARSSDLNCTVGPKLLTSAVAAVCLRFKPTLVFGFLNLVFDDWTREEPGPCSIDFRYSSYGVVTFSSSTVALFFELKLGFYT